MQLKLTLKPSRHPIAVCILTAMLLSACADTEMASYMIDGSKHSLTLIREKSFVWNKEWSLTFITTGQPACQRRHKLNPAQGSQFKTDLYRSYDGAFILHQDPYWYVTETRNCQLQTFPTPPPEPGDLLGSFETKDGVFKFVAAPELAAPTEPSAIAPAPVSPAPAVEPPQYAPAPQPTAAPDYPQPVGQPMPAPAAPVR